ncbi:MAG: CCA tRNA nucleotidyltransferase [Candidatus Binatia bacterium]
MALGIVRRLRDAGHTAVLAGGCVRDRLLGLEDPAGDYDVATSARPEEVQRLFPRNVSVGAQFGVILVLGDGVKVEVATFRSDDAYVDGRHPQSVRFTTPEEDARRRDFTINGMFYDPIEDRVLDYVGGREDLGRRIVRAIGDPKSRFGEDKLRLVRGVRFAARLGFALDPATAEATRQMAPQIRQVSQERIGEEVVKILLEGAARRGFELLSETALLREILPEIEAMKGVEQGREYHPEGDVFVHTMLALGELDRSPLRDRLLASAGGESEGNRLEALSLGTLLHDVAKPECRQDADGKITFYGHCERGAEIALAVCRRLRRSNAVGERASWLVRNHLRVLNAPEMRVATLKRFLREDGIEELLELCRIDATASSGNLFYYEFCREALGRFSKEAMKPPPLLTGRDLIALGYTPGPAFKRILSTIEEAQLEGTLTSREEAAAFVREHFPPGG